MGRLESPTLEVIGVFVIVYILQAAGNVVGIPAGWFALAAPMDRPWSIVTSVYAHAGANHLIVNSIALLIIGLPLERFAAWWRYHAFFLGTGAAAGLVQIGVVGLLGSGGTVLGASGAILALYGYALAGNPVTGGLLARLGLSRRVKLWLLGLAAVTVVILTAGPGVALVAHGTGFAMGLIGGRFGVLARR